MIAELINMVLNTKKIKSKLVSFMILTMTGTGIALTIYYLKPTTILFAMLMIVMAVPAVRDMLRKDFDVYEIRNVFTLGYFMSFGISTLYSINIRMRYIEESVFYEVFPRVLMYAMAALLLFYAGYHNNISRSIAKKLPVLDGIWDKSRVTLVTIAFAAIGIALYLYLLLQSGGLLFYLENVYRINDLLMGNYYLFLMAKTFLFSALIICYAWAQETLSIRYVFGAYFLLLVMFLFGITTGYRGTIFMPILGMMIVRHYSPSRISYEKYFLILFIVVNVSLIPLYSITRYSSSELGNYDAVESDDDHAMVYALNRYYGVESFALIIDKIDHGLELQYGKTILSIFYEVIPRGIWPDKPFSTGFLFVDIFMPDYFLSRLVAGMSTLPGELYWNFSLIGMLISMFFIGLFFKISYSYFTMNLNKSTILVYLPFVIYAFAVNEGSIAGHAVTDLISYEVPALIGCAAITARKRND